MQHNPEQRLRHRSKFSQLLLLNERGHIVSSCDSIFPAHKFRDDQLLKNFPFLESILPSLKQLPLGSDINFSKIETPLDALPGIYDFSFHKILIEEELQILWGIYDYSDLYEEYKQFQQRKNELEMHRELLERRHRNLRSREELRLQQNIILEHLDHIQLTYFNRIKTALLAPINPLDGMLLMLAPQRQTPPYSKRKDYLEHLQRTLDHLQMIVREFPHPQDVNSANDQNNYSLVRTFADLKYFVELKLGHSIPLIVEIDESIPQQIADSLQALQQILFGLILNCFTLHPDSSLKLQVVYSKKDKTRSPRPLHITFTEKLHNRSSILSASDYQDLLTRLSIVRQLIEANGGNIQVLKNAKDLSIDISFDYEIQDLRRIS